jgi:hypothetical protein
MKRLVRLALAALMAWTIGSVAAYAGYIAENGLLQVAGYASMAAGAVLALATVVAVIVRLVAWTRD